MTPPAKRCHYLLLAMLTACASCSAPASPRYFSDETYRRDELVASLVNPANGYSRLRLERYATSGGWDALPEWNPRTERVRVDELAPGLPARPLSDDARAVAIAEGAEAGDEAALRAIGESAFFGYPVQLAPAASRVMASGGALEGYGFWSDANAGAGGLVRVELADGTTTLGYSCATCHAAPRSGVVVPGLANDRLDLGRLAVDAGLVSASDASAFSAWGRGRLDVTTTNGTEPVVVSDLRPLKWLTHLHHDATVSQRDLVSLAIRIETLIITSHQQTIRPPRVISLGLATYLWSLGAALGRDAASSTLERDGQALFESACTACHRAPSYTGPPVSLAVVGTDPTLGLSADRGTGAYRVPSLRGVRERGLLLHDGGVASLEALFDPLRVLPTYAGGVRAGPVAGHDFTLRFGNDDRAALIAFLRTL